MRGVVALLPALALALPSPALAKRKLPPQLDAWAACAAQKNASDVAWVYMLESGQSGLQGPALGGARVYAVMMLARDCAPEGTGFDNDTMTALAEKAVAAWNGDRAARSQSRPIDGWADCLAAKDPAKGRAFLAARDIDFAGPTLIVDGVNPITAIEAPSATCDAQRPATINHTDLYARLNFRLRVEPRLSEPAA